MATLSSNIFIFSTILMLSAFSFCGAVKSMETYSTYLSGTATHIQLSDQSYLYVGGENFIAEYSSEGTPQLVTEFRLGPIDSAQHCYPNPAPCSNHVTLLKIDPVQHKLLVCGTAYQGTCTMHEIGNIWDWKCVFSEKRDNTSNVVTSNPKARFVAHYVKELTETAEQSEFDWSLLTSCRPESFGGMYYSTYPTEELGDNETESSSSRRTVNSRQMDALQPVDAIRDTNINDSSENVAIPLIYKVRSTRFFIAGNNFQNGHPNPQPPTLSQRIISSRDYMTLTMKYDRDKGSRVTGFSFDPKLIVDFRYSFSNGNYSYFLYVAVTSCGNDARGSTRICYTTKILRLCEGSSGNILPSVEMELFCEDEATSQFKTKYNYLEAAELGEVSLGTSLHQTLIAAFSIKGTGQDDEGSNPKLAICTFSIDQLNIDLNFEIQECNSGFGDAYQDNAIRGSNGYCTKVLETDAKSCSSAPVNPHIVSRGSSQSKFLTSIPVAAASELLLYRSPDWSSPTLDAFIVATNGSVYKIYIEWINKDEQIVRGGGPAVVFTLDKAAPDSSRPSGIVDSDKAFMYITHGTKLTRLVLDTCRQYVTCHECQNSQSCAWCKTKRQCLDSVVIQDQCFNYKEAPCPPVIHSFSPRFVPLGGGTELQLTGRDLGNQSDHVDVTVTVCGQSCDQIRSYHGSLSCVLKPCYNCTDGCSISVVIKYKREQDEETMKTTSKEMRGGGILYYVDPSMSSFSPNSGPAQGGTIVTLTGTYLTSGRRVKVMVGNTTCKVNTPVSVSMDRKAEIQCRMSPEVGGPLDCHNVSVTIDQHDVSAETNQSFCFNPNPIITQVSPTKTIKSGGVTITLTGTGLDSGTSNYLLVQVNFTDITDSSSLPLLLRQQCELKQQPARFVCEAPEWKDERKYRLDLPAEAYLAFYVDGENILKDEQSSLYIHRDPVFYSDNSTHISKREPHLKLRGQYIPSWLTPSDFKITVGNELCNVISVQSDHVVCDGTNAWLQYERDVIREAIRREEETQTTSGVTTTFTSSPNISDDMIASNIEVTTAPTSAETTDQTNETVFYTPEPSWTTHPNSGQMNDSSPTIEPDGDGGLRVKRQASDEGRLILRDLRSRRLKKMALDDFKIQLCSKNESYIEVPRRENSHFYYSLRIHVGNYHQCLIVSVGPRRLADSADSSFFKKQNLILIGAAGGLVFVIFLIVLICCYRKCRNDTKKRLSQQASGELSPQKSLKDILDKLSKNKNETGLTEKLEISMDRLTIGRTIGNGNFGCVCEGLLALPGGLGTAKVAIKTLQESEVNFLNTEAFIEEAVRMRDFDHDNVLGLIGLAEEKIGRPYVILPFMDNGDLLNYVKDTSRSLSLHDVIKFGADIASGMEYISNQKFVHRDLAARNCMLDCELRVKVADFGLSREVYGKGYYSTELKNKKLPIKWMAQESLADGHYTTESDVWSFGVVMWELLTRGMIPYPGVDNCDVFRFLQKRRLDPPVYCPEQLYRLMLTCWAKEPKCRPTFKRIRFELLQMVGETPEPSAQPNDDKMKRLSTFSPTAGIKPSAYKSPKGSKATTPTSAGLVGNPPQFIVSSPDQLATVELRREQHAYSEIPETPAIKPVKNVMITFPACQDMKHPSKEAKAQCAQLVQNYEPAPRFSNPDESSKSKKGRWKTRSSSKQRSQTSSTGYSSAFLITEGENGKKNSYNHLYKHVSSDGQLLPYYELETSAMRDSAASSVLFRASGSIDSNLDSSVQSNSPVPQHHPRSVSANMNDAVSDVNRSEMSSNASSNDGYLVPKPRLTPVPVPRKRPPIVQPQRRTSSSSAPYSTRSLPRDVVRTPSRDGSMTGTETHL